MSEILDAFQFHKGTIRTGTAETAPTADTSFQFHKGTIRTIALCKAESISNYFNSIKVQLERVCPSAVLSSIALFQFHKGTIRTRNWYNNMLHVRISIP